MQKIKVYIVDKNGDSIKKLLRTFLKLSQFIVDYETRSYTIPGLSFELNENKNIPNLIIVNTDIANQYPDNSIKEIKDKINVPIIGLGLNKEKSDILAHGYDAFLPKTFTLKNVKSSILPFLSSEKLKEVEQRNAILSQKLDGKKSSPTSTDDAQSKASPSSEHKTVQDTKPELKTQVSSELKTQTSSEHKAKTGVSPEHKSETHTSPEKKTGLKPSPAINLGKEHVDNTGEKHSDIKSGKKSSDVNTEKKGTDIKSGKRDAHTNSGKRDERSSSIKLPGDHQESNGNIVIDLNDKSVRHNADNQSKHEDGNGNSFRLPKEENHPNDFNVDSSNDGNNPEPIPGGAENDNDKDENSKSWDIKI